MSDKAFVYGPGNPHPLSQMRTELVWEGKYDEYGRRREVNVSELSMPMQRIETVDEPRSRAEATGQLPLWERQKNKVREQEGEYADWRNRLIWGDNKLVMASLLKELKAKIDLIYIDPPFDVGADFRMDVPIGEGKETIEKDQSTLEMVAYRDMWGKGTDSYLQMMFERLSLMRDLLSPQGSIVVHVDWRVGSLMRRLLDELFGEQRFVNEIIWWYSGAGASPERFSRRHDNLFWYAKGDSWYFDPDPLRTEYAEATKERFSHYIGNVRNGRDFGQQELNPKGKHPDDVIRVSIEAPSALERTGFPTQKPLQLSHQLIEGLCPPSGLCADFFCGSGTTLKAAEMLGRRWIGSDLGRFAIHTSRKRMLDVQRELHEGGSLYRPFDLYNLGRYERQWWQRDRLKGADDEHRRVVLEFFKAEILASAPSPLLHGRKAGAFCHVDGIDSVFSRQEARAVAEAVLAAGGREAYCLAWEFEMELRQHCLALEAELSVKLKLIPIPREIMEKNRKSPPPFLEMAVLEAEPVVRKTGGKTIVDVKLTKFLPSLAEVPSKELEALKERAIKSGFDFIDFWAVDFGWHPGQPFHHNWQDYRTRKDRSLRTVSDAGHAYAEPGKHTICVKVVDVFGCDTSITLPVEV